MSNELYLKDLGLTHHSEEHEKLSDKIVSLYFEGLPYADAIGLLECIETTLRGRLIVTKPRSPKRPTLD